MRRIITVSFSLLFIQSLSAEPELKGSPVELSAYLATVPRTVSVTGESEVKVQADRADIRLKVTTENKSLQDALRNNQEIRSRIVGALKDHGIPADRIQASRFCSTPKYGLFGDKAKSYRVENILKVTVHDDKEFQATAHLVDAFAEVQYQGIDFEHSDKEALKKKALAQALEDASANRKVYEERLGVTLKPKGVSQSAVARTFPQRALVYSDQSGLKYSSPQSARQSLLAQPAEGNPGANEEAGSLFGEILFAGRVIVDYAVEQK
jgi:uncharacterized protein YggE